MNPYTKEQFLADEPCADAYAYAADAADRLSERKWQADKIRELIPNPFREIEVSKEEAVKA